MTDRDFRQVQRELDDVVSKLKTAVEPKLRTDLLQQMRGYWRKLNASSLAPECDAIR